MHDRFLANKERVKRKMITDGFAAAGGLIRDFLGRCCTAFASNVGKCSIAAAELKGAIVGLQLAWEKGYRKVQLKMDSTITIAIIWDRSDDDHRHGLLEKQVNHLLERDWDVAVSHVYREGNQTADFLANLGHGLTFGTHHVDVLNFDLCRWLDYDVSRLEKADGGGQRLKARGKEIWKRKTSIMIGGGVAQEDILALGPGCGSLTMVGSRSTSRMGVKQWTRPNMMASKVMGLIAHVDEMENSDTSLHDYGEAHRPAGSSG
ncbi:unnamed protein product [Linum tenue]|uniref:RNase H type-1 domain-containing protein n=1 Tax=Linum tenue TaxID=586396 RepID=A0AAV0N784_9ROSI|nr:unnamed protein product [Linum tenue]